MRAVKIRGFKYNILISVVVLCLSCKQGDPPVPEPKQNSDFIFSGIKWNLKSDKIDKMGPGPNYFSDSSANVWIDASNYLHLKITNRNGKWECPEIISENKFGFGTYVFTIASDVANLNERVVLGLFTWDNTSFYEQANSEVDIEFSKWTVASDSLTLTYSAQPVQFDNPIPYYERNKKPVMQVSKLKTLSVHAFNWTDSLITWKSYEGDVYPGTNLIASWQFDKSNPSRIKMEGGRNSNPIIIPLPGSDTHARINLWLLNGLPPSDNKEVEVIIKSFKFIPN